MTNRLSFLLRYALKRNTLPWYVQINDTDRDNIPDRYDVGRAPDEALGQLGNMHQSVLMHADIDERAEVGHVPHDAVKHHSHTQRSDIHRIGAQDGLRQLVAGVAAGLLQLGDDVGKCRQADTQFGSKPLFSRFFDFFGQCVKCPVPHIRLRITGSLQQPLSRVIRLGVDSSVVQRIVTFGHAQKARALAEGFFTDAFYLFQLGARFKPLFLPIIADALRGLGVDAGDVRQQ